MNPFEPDTPEHSAWAVLDAKPLAWGDEQPTYTDQLRAALVDTDGLDMLPDPLPLIGADIIFRDSLVWLIGKPGSAKSFVALDIAGCVATDESWQGWQVEPGPVLYVVAEGVSGVKKRVRAWEKAMGRKMTGVKFLPIAVQAKNAEAWKALTAVAAEIGPALIILDTQARVTLGINENDNSEMGLFIDRAEALRTATHACVMIVHHIGKADNGGRGATAVEGAVDTIIKVSKDDRQVTLDCTKNKNGEEWESISLRLVPMGNSVVLVIDHDKGGSRPADACAKNLARWLELLGKEWVSTSTLIKAEVFAERTFFNWRLKLINAGVIEKQGEKSSTRYRLT